jgi:hypothetical protein
MMIPMAISLGFGILFALFITLAIVPTLYMTVADARKLFVGPRETDARATAPPAEPAAPGGE